MSMKFRFGANDGPTEPVTQVNPTPVPNTPADEEVTVDVQSGSTPALNRMPDVEPPSAVNHSGKNIRTLKATSPGLESGEKSTVGMSYSEIRAAAARYGAGSR